MFHALTTFRLSNFDICFDNQPPLNVPYKKTKLDPLSLKSLKVLIADDHEIVRKGIRQILIDEFAFAEIEEVADTKSLVEKALSDTWDIIISDLAMPGGGGLEGLSRIRVKLPFQRILIVSIYPEEQYAVRVMKSGASGFLNKNSATEELVNAVNRILSGRRYLQPTISDTMANILMLQGGILSHELLDENEYDILLKLSAGLSVSEIAEKLSITVNQVTSQRSRILHRMSLKTNEDLSNYCIENNLI